MVYLSERECSEGQYEAQIRDGSARYCRQRHRDLRGAYHHFFRGLYSLSDIRSEINNYCAGKNIPDTLIDVIGHTPTQSVEMHWDVQASGYGCVIYMSDADSIEALLGYSEDLVYDSYADEVSVELAIFRAHEAAHFDAICLGLMLSPIHI